MSLRGAALQLHIDVCDGAPVDLMVDVPHRALGTCTACGCDEATACVVSLDVHMHSVAVTRVLVGRAGPLAG